MSISEQYTDPKIWGSKFWFVFRCIAHNYSLEPTNEEMARAKTFYQQFTYLLPCITCRESYELHYDEVNIDNYLDNRNKLIEWVEIIYNKTLENINVNNQIKKSIEIKVDENKSVEQPKVTPPPRSRGCTTCNKGRAPPNETLFPKATEINSGVGKGYVGGLRKALTTSPTEHKYIIITYYNWIKNQHKIPTKEEATNILKGYNIIKNINASNYYPDTFVINSVLFSLADTNSDILTNPTTSNLIYLKFKELSI